MDNRLTDLSHPAVAAQSRNKTAIAGTCTMNTVLAAVYIAEVLKGVRSLPSYLIFLLLCLLLLHLDSSGGLGSAAGKILHCGLCAGDGITKL